MDTRTDEAGTRPTIYKAQSTGGQAVPDLNLSATEEFPPVPGQVNHCRLIVEQAGAIADALFESLPGGTLDALLAEMMQRKASQLAVAHRLRPLSPDSAEIQRISRLESDLDRVHHSHDKLERQRDELLAACEAILAAFPKSPSGGRCLIGGKAIAAAEVVSAAVARARGGAA